MERKNTILLTVIAIATLLVAVVGATFAYFTAGLTIQNDNKDNTSAADVTTKVFVNTTFDYGNKINPLDDAIPGHADLKTMKVTGSDGDEAATIKLTMTPNIATEFGDDVKYKLYSVNTSEIETKKVTCTESTRVAVPGDDGNVNYSDSMTCSATGDISPVINGSFSGQTPVEYTITVEPNSDVTYFLVVQYENDPSSAQAAQGKTYKVDLKVENVPNKNA